MKNKLFLTIDDCLITLKKIPNDSMDLIIIDPPYNIDIADWDKFENYIQWASLWLNECYRVLKSTGNLVIFGGFQYRNKATGDLVELIHYIRHYTKFKIVNNIVWYYKNGISAQRFFSNRHEDLIWIVKSNKYYFDLDSVRIPYDEKTKKIYKKDKRLNPLNIEKGKNPTNVWLFNRLNGNSKERVGHPTQKPLNLLARIIKSMSPNDGIVLDFFAGSGSSGVSAILEGRNAILSDSNKSSKNYLNSLLKYSGLDSKEYLCASINDLLEKKNNN
ncbi:DNA-methyltransferase [Limosilactobacillus reuteri]|uniref:DNA methylase N-4/N-6 domain-containing protein n=1 Tax=Limosilactobacillus reuteri TaxID=1598 RepID=A0A256SR86_LIMRT|nr:site-specific DNA-methyltransferase [Limosilactobacillus reuteri]OYS68658.1 hypothetical protein CBF96_07155 [Limosilactobacillus reuteri]